MKYDQQYCNNLQHVIHRLQHNQLYNCSTCIFGTPRCPFDVLLEPNSSSKPMYVQHQRAHSCSAIPAHPLHLLFRWL